MIKFVNVSKAYSEYYALNEISFGIDSGEFILLTGHSGSGKTTIIKMLIREIVPDEGQILIGEQNIVKLRRRQVSRLRRKIGVVFQDFKLLDDKTVYENVAFALEASGRTDDEIKEIVPSVLEIVNIEDKINAFPQQLSGGQKQKVAIARAIANDPEILIADEPTGNLDNDATWEIIKILEKVNKWGTTVIMSTHEKDVINKLSYRTIILEEGSVISDSAKGENKAKRKPKLKVSAGAKTAPTVEKPELEEIENVEEETETKPENKKEDNKSSNDLEKTLELDENQTASEEPVEKSETKKKPKAAAKKKRSLKIGLTNSKSKVKKAKTETTSKDDLEIKSPENPELTEPDAFEKLSAKAKKLLKTEEIFTPKQLSELNLDEFAKANKISDKIIEEYRNVVVEFYKK